MTNNEVIGHVSLTKNEVAINADKIVNLVTVLRVEIRHGTTWFRCDPTYFSRWLFAYWIGPGVCVCV